MRKVIFITGISSGFGKEIACQLEKKGHIVYGTIRSECEVCENVKTVHIELTQPDTIKKAISEVIENEGRIDILINNAGMHTGGPIEETPREIFEAQMNTNFFGWVNLINEVLPYMRKQGGGTIINISSIGGLTGLPFQGVYSSAKFALEGMSAALRSELKAFNIKVVMVNPGDFCTRNTETRIVSINKDSPYAQQFKKSLSIISTDENCGKHPGLLAAKICKIVEKKNPRQRYLVGATIQKLAVFIQRITPEPFFRRIIEKHYGIK